MKKYWYSICPVCEEGRLFVCKQKDLDRLFLLCEECESAWETPEDVSLNTYFKHANEIEYSTQEDIVQYGWAKYSDNLKELV